MALRRTEPALKPPQLSPVDDRATSGQLSAAVSLRGVSARFGDRNGLDGIDLTVGGGQVFGLLGPSGCGKSTLVRMLVGIGHPTEGEVLVNGKPPWQFTLADRGQIGYVPQGFYLYPSLTVLQNARFVAKLYGLGWSARRRRTRQVLKRLELWEARNVKAKNISGGMQRRLVLASALFHEPRTLVIDEPTARLDPLLRSKVWDYLLKLRESGVTIILTTQYIEEAEYCDRVGILHHGQLVAEGAPDELRKRAAGGEALDVRAPRFERGDIAALWQLPCVRAARWIAEDELRCTVDDIGEATVAITDALHERGTDVTSVRPHAPTFDEAFLALVGPQ